MRPAAVDYAYGGAMLKLKQKTTWMVSRARAENAVDSFATLSLAGVVVIGIGGVLALAAGSMVGVSVVVAGYIALCASGLRLRPLARYMARFGSDEGARVIRGVMLCGGSAIVMAAEQDIEGLVGVELTSPRRVSGP